MPADVACSILEESNGLLVKNGDVADLSEKIFWMIENPRRRKEMGEKGRKRALDFTQDNIMLKWKSLFDSLVD